MAAPTREIINQESKQQETAEVLAFESNRQMRDARRKIGFLAGDTTYRKLAAKESISEYDKLATGSESMHLTPEQVEGFYQYLKEDYDAATGAFKAIDDMLQKAVYSKIAGPRDRKFIIENLILKDSEHLGKETAAEAIEIVKEKIAHMEEDKNEWAEFHEHPLIKETGMLIVDASTQISVPDEASFLDMKVPDRRTLLKKLKDHLKKAEAYAKTVENVTSLENFNQYKTLLHGALAKKIIGQKTMDKFLKAFQKIDAKDQENWIDSFDEEMERYEELWDNIRSTLRQPALGIMEAKRSNLGWTELFNAFGDIKEKESNRLENFYAQGLEQAQREGLIGDRTFDTYMEAFSAHDLEARYEGLDQLPAQMQQYKALVAQEQSLSAKHKMVLAANWNEWGYSERHTFLANPNAYTADAEEKDTAAEALNVITDRSKREAILETRDILDERGVEDKKVVLKMIKMFRRGPREQFDAADYQTSLRGSKAEAAHEELEDRIDHIEALPEVQADQAILHPEVIDEIDINENELEGPLEKRRAMELVQDQHKEILEDIDSIESAEDIQEVAPTGREKVVALTDFEEAQFEDERGKRKRVFNVTLNSEYGVNNLLSKHSQGSYRTQAEGGNDVGRFSLWAADTAIKMNHEDMLAFEKMLQKDIELNH